MEESTSPTSKRGNAKEKQPLNAQKPLEESKAF
jgi:hypothetical protein